MFLQRRRMRRRRLDCETKLELMNDSKEFGKKLVDKAIAEKTGHRIAVIGGEVFSSLYPQAIEGKNYNAELYRIEDFHKLDRLLNYTLCIVGYNSFNDQDVQSNFIKQMFEAMKNGVNFCFVYYKEHPSTNEATGHKNVAYQILQSLNIANPSAFKEVSHEATRISAFSEQMGRNKP